MKRRALSILTLAVLIITAIPSYAAESLQKQEETADISVPAVSVKLKEKDSGREGNSESRTVLLEASLDLEQDKISEADVKIALNEEEVKLLKALEDKSGAEMKADESEGGEQSGGEAEGREQSGDKASGSYEKYGPVLVTEESGAGYIGFSLDRNAPLLETSIEFAIPSDMSSSKDSFKIDIQQEDITVEAGISQEESEGLIYKEGVSFTLERSKEAAEPEQEAQDEKQKKSYAAGNSAIEDVSDMKISVEEYNKAINKTIYWADNNNEAGLRPEASAYKDKYRPVMKFSFDGGKTKYTLTEENRAYLGMAMVPVGSVSHETGTRQYHYTLTGDVLPSKITYTDEYGDEATYNVTWYLEPAEVDGYIFADVNDDNKEDFPSAKGQTGWYYMLEDSFEFDIVIRWGNIGKDRETIDKVVKDLEKIAERFSFNISYSDKELAYTLAELEERNALEVKVTEPGSDKLSETWTLKISGLCKYNIDGSRMSYEINENEETAGDSSGRVEISDDVLGEGSEDDYFAISYDNSKISSTVNELDKVYNQGTLYLTLTGKTIFNAEKIWLDEDGNKAERPQGEFLLWRYRAGEGYKTAAMVRDDAGIPLECKLKTEEDEQEIVFKDSKGEDVVLDKYDSEGCRYYYVVREYLEGSGYEQVFGHVDRDGSITDKRDEGGELVIVDDAKGTRDDGNDFVYNGGTLTNRIKKDADVEVTKLWKAAAFQSEFEDVTVELTLQSRVKGDKDSQWQDAGEEPVRIEGFQLEHMSETSSVNVPQFNYLGQELEYRWVETGVFQGKDSEENLIQQDGENFDTEKKFSLIQSGKKINYISKLTLEEDDSSLIENSISNTINYDIEKKWLDSQGKETDAPEGAEVKIALYRSAGSADMGERVGYVTLDGKRDSEKQTVNEKLGVYARESEPWKLRITPLDEYDEEGRLYEYKIIERNESYLPEYEVTKDDEGNYDAVIINRPGTGNRILVQKNWVDDSNTADRRAVNIGVYEKADDKRIAGVTLRDGIWNDYVYIGQLGTDDVYILEESVGEGDGAVSVEPPDAGEPILYEGKNSKDYTKTFFNTGKENYKYMATYSKNEVEGETVYAVTNTRIGTVDLTVHKKWLDGDESKREELEAAAEELKEKGKTLALALRLDFSEASQGGGYKISYNGIDKTDYVDVGNMDGQVEIKAPPAGDGTGDEPRGASAVQTVDFSKDKSYCFYNLPKYDGGGKVVNYRAEEVWVDENGKTVDLKKLSETDEAYKPLYEAWKEYRTSYSEETYQVGDYHSDDKQNYTITNRLAGTKDVSWHKDWNDEFSYDNNTRPDVFLDIYSVSHKSENQDDTETELVRKNYKWSYKEYSDDEEETDIRHHWRVDLEDMPKYDDFGYEIMYYAVENTSVNYEDFDYVEAQYYITEDCILDSNERIGSETEITDEGALDRGEVIDICGAEGAGTITYDASADGSHRYALVEDGAFSNNLYKDFVVTGQKIWSSLPSGYSDVDLPAVKFELYRNDPSEPDKAKEYVSEITVSRWADIKANGSYSFDILYEGVNTMTVEDGGTVVISGEEKDGQAAKPLPKYNEEGQLYEYELREADVIWNFDENSGVLEADLPESWEDVFSYSASGYAADNVYDSEKGSLSIKKFLELPMKDDGTPEAYPAVTFQLLRTYTTNDGGTSEPEAVAQKIWSSAEVKKEYEDATGIFASFKAFFTGKDIKTAGTAANPLEKILSFDNLDIYAPNGSKYVYQVREIKDNLGGYDTWAGKGDLTAQQVKTEMYEKTEEVGGLSLQEEGGDSSVEATFLNAQSTERATVKISGKKLWQDFENIFGKRPDEITIKLYRYASSQPGQSNAIAQHEVDKDLYNVAWEKDGDASSWSYEIRGSAEGELEKYAPNGMLWRYRVQEVSLDGSIYVSSPNWVSESGWKDDEDGNRDITMGDLSNSIVNSVPYSKKWVNSDNEPVEEDLLGIDIEVDFALQVAEANTRQPGGQQSGSPAIEGDWQSAKEYFENNLTLENYQKLFEDYEFTDSMRGRLGDEAAWKEKTFSNLPRHIKKSGEEDMTRLYYRVVETEISYGNASQTVTVIEDEQDSFKYTYEFSSGIFSPAYPLAEDASGGNEPGTSQGYNSSADSTAYNMLRTTALSVQKNWRGDSGNPYGTRPDTERNNYDWEVQLVIQRSADGGAAWENVTIYEGQTEKALVVSLYGKDDESSAKAEVSGLLETDVDGKSYTYRARELKPAEDRYSDGIVSDEDLVQDGDSFNVSYEAGYESGAAGTVTNTLKNRNIYAEKIWNRSAEPETITFELQYLKAGGSAENNQDWKSFSPKAQVTLDGKVSGSETGQSYAEYLPWKAVWYDVPEVMADSQLDDDNKTRYRIKETLPAGYKQEGVTETTMEAGGEKHLKFEIENNETTELTVEKKWYGIPASKRQEIVAGLWRTTGTPGDEASEKVLDSDGKQLTKTLNSSAGASAAWKASFTDLSKYNNDKGSDDYGKAYTYYAREITAGGVPVSELGYYVVNKDSEDKSAFNSTLINIGRVDISGTKTWKDNGNAYDTRPDSIELKLYRTPQGGREELVSGETLKTEGASLKWSDKDEDVWRYVYEELPAADSQGRQYAYRVEEETVEAKDASSNGDEYAVSQEGNNITNTLTDTIEIPVIKKWHDSDNKYDCRPDRVTVILYGDDEEISHREISGRGSQWKYTFENLPEYDEQGRRIEYRVEEADVPEGYDVFIDGFVIENTARGSLSVAKTLEGSAADKDREFNFTVRLSDEEINGRYGDMEFTDGTAHIVLKDGEIKTAKELPAGTEYVVSEAEANTGGYRTTSSNAAGNVPAGDDVKAHFINSKSMAAEADDTQKTKTGDSMNLAVPLVIMTLSLIGIAAVMLRRKNKSK